MSSNEITTNSASNATTSTTATTAAGNEKSNKPPPSSSSTSNKPKVKKIVNKKPEPYDPFNLFEYDNRAIAFQTLERINENILNNTSKVSSALNYQDINGSLSSNSSLSISNNRRRASISSPSSSSKSFNRKSPRQWREFNQSSLPSSPVKRLNNQSRVSSVSGSNSTPRHVFNRSNSDSQSLTSNNSKFTSSSKRRASISGTTGSGNTTSGGVGIVWMNDKYQQYHPNNCICDHCGHEMKFNEEKKALVTPTNEIFKALTEIEYEQALKQSMKGMDKVNLNDEEQLDLVAEILSETLLKNEGLSLSKRKQKPKKTTHFSQTETYFENLVENRPSTQQVMENHFDFTDSDQIKQPITNNRNTINNTNPTNNNNRNTNFTTNNNNNRNTQNENKKSNVKIIRNIEEKNVSPLDEECKLISEPFITIQNNRMNFYPNEPTRIIPVTMKRQSPQPTLPSSQSQSHQQQPQQQTREVHQQPIYVKTRKSPSPSYEQVPTEYPSQKFTNETQTNASMDFNRDEEEDEYDGNYKDQCMNTDFIEFSDELRDELYEKAKRKGQDEIVSMYINSKLKERSKKHSNRIDRKSSLSYLFPGLYKKIQTDLKLKRLESMDPYKKPMNNIIQEMKSLVERC